MTPTLRPIQPEQWQSADTNVSYLITDKNGNRIAEFPRHGGGFIDQGEVAPWHCAKEHRDFILSAANSLHAAGIQNPEKLMEFLAAVVELEYRASRAYLPEIQDYSAIRKDCAALKNAFEALTGKDMSRWENDNHEALAAVKGKE